jgi:tetratricopeptide (TPR) repeat protein
MREGRARWLLVGSAALLPILVGLVVNLATGLDLPAFTRNPWLVWPALVVLSLLSVLVALRLTAAADQSHVVSLAGRVGLLAASARLPADPTPLVGRDSELAELRGFFTARGPAGPRVAVLSGLPGVGKSAMAVHLARQLAGRVDRRPLYADLGGLGAGRRDPAEVLGWFLHALRVPDEAMPSGLEERADLYQSLLAEQRALVVLDNAADADQVRLLLPEGPRCWVVVTSRARLATLARARLVELGVLPEAAAVRVLEALAGPEQIAADRDAAREVARVCGFLPLAVRIATARLRSRPGWTVARLAEELADRRHRLARLKVEDLEVRASFALSYDDLPEAAARTFRLLGLLAGPESTAEITAALTGDAPAVAEDALEALVDAQLLEVVEPGRYRLHDLLYLFAQELAAGEPAEQQHAALGRALGWLAARATQADQLLRGEAPTADKDGEAEPAARVFPDRTAALAWLVAERPNLVAAVHLAFEQRLYPLAWQVADGLETFFEVRGFWPQWRDTQGVVLRAAQAAGSRSAAARALLSLGRVCRELRRFEEAIDYSGQALAISREVGDRRGEGRTLNNLGLVSDELRRFEEAIDYYRQALAISREVGDRRGEGRTLNNLGLASYNLRRFEEAIDYYRQALAIHREVGDHPAEGKLTITLGDVYEAQRRLEMAMLSYEQALAIFEGRDDRNHQGVVLAKMGDLARRQRHRGKAISYHRRSLAIFEQLGDRHRQDWALMTLADLAREQGRLEDAAAYDGQRLALPEEPGSTHPSPS